MIVLETDCPDCGSAGSVHRAVCDVCLAELDEQPRAPLAHAAARPAPPGLAGETTGAPVPVVSPPLRFTDVIAELEMIALLCDSTGAGPALLAACERARLLFESLRHQFLRDVVG